MWDGLRQWWAHRQHDTRVHDTTSFCEGPECVEDRSASEMQLLSEVKARLDRAEAEIVELVNVRHRSEGVR